MAGHCRSWPRRGAARGRGERPGGQGAVHPPAASAPRPRSAREQLPTRHRDHRCPAGRCRSDRPRYRRRRRRTACHGTGPSRCGCRRPRRAENHCPPSRGSDRCLRARRTCRHPRCPRACRGRPWRQTGQAVRRAPRRPLPMARHPGMRSSSLHIDGWTRFQVFSGRKGSRSTSSAGRRPGGAHAAAGPAAGHRRPQRS